MKELVLGILIFLSGAIPVAGSDQDAVVQLRVVYRDSKVAYGTGFFYKADGSIMTCYHVIEEARRIEVLDRNGKPYRDIRVLGFSQLHDIATIRIINAENDFPTLSLINDSPDKFPDNINQRKGIILTSLAKLKPLEITIVTDLIKAAYLEELFKQGAAFSPAGEDVRLYGISAVISNGMSGSPVLYNGKVLGILSGSKSQGGDFAWIIPILHAKSMNDQKERSVSDIGSWPKLALMNTEWNMLSQFERSYIKEGGDGESRVEIIYPRVFTGKSARILIRPHHVELSRVIVGDAEAIRQPSGEFLATLFWDVDHTKMMKVTAFLSNENTTVDGTIQMTRLDLEKIHGQADQVRAEVVKVQSHSKDFETAFLTLRSISDPEMAQKARRYMAEILIEHGRFDDAAELANTITDDNERSRYISSLVTKYIEMEKPDAAVQVVEESLPPGCRGSEYEKIADYLVTKDKMDFAIEICRKIQDRNDQSDLFQGIARTQLERNRPDSAGKILFYSRPQGNLHIGNKIEMAIWVAHAQYKSGSSEGALDALGQAFKAAGLMESDENEKVAEKLDEFLAIAIAQHRLNFTQDSKKTLKAACDLVMSIKSQLRKDILFKDDLLMDTAATLSAIGDYNEAFEYVSKIVLPSKRTLGYIYTALNLLRNKEFEHVRKIVTAVEQNRDKLNEDSESPHRQHKFRTVCGYKEHPAWYRSWFPPGTYEHTMKKLEFDIIPTDTDSSLGLIAKEFAVAGDIHGCIETLKFIRDTGDKDIALWESSIHLMQKGNRHESYGFAGGIKSPYKRALAFVEIAKNETQQISIISKTPSAIPISERIAKQDLKDLDEVLNVYFKITEYLINANATEKASAYYQRCLEHMNGNIQKMQGKASQDTDRVAEMLVKFMRLFRGNNMDQRFNEAAELFQSVSILYKKKTEPLVHGEIGPSMHLYMNYAAELAWVGRYHEAITYAKMDFEDDEAMEKIVYVQCVKKDFDAARETIKLMDESFEKERALNILSGHERSHAPDRAMTTVSEMNPGYKRDNSYWNVAMSLSDFLEKMATMDKIKDQEQFEDQRIEMIVKWARFNDLEPLLLWLRSGESVTPNRRLNAYLGITDRYQ